METTSKIPRVIYTYWHSKEVPNTVQKCIDSWKRHCPTYTIHLITKDTIDKYMDTSLLHHSLGQAFLSDMIRLHVLADKGGIWMDASVYLNEPLDWVHSYQVHTDCELVGYEQFPRDQIVSNRVESWFFACIPRSPFMLAWKKEFFRVQRYRSVDVYIASLIKKGVKLDHLPDSNYLCVYASSQQILQKGGPYELQLLDGNGPLSMICMVTYPFYPLFYKEPVIKYISLTRKIMESSGLYRLLN
jgi:hypothetical protein